MFIVVGQEQFALHSELSPSLVHSVYAPQSPVPHIRQSYSGEVEYMYRANGRILVQSIFVPRGLSLGSALRQHVDCTDRIAAGALLGPIVFPGAQGEITTHFNGWPGFGVWALKETVQQGQIRVE